MRYLVAFFATFAFVAGSTAQINCSQSQAANPGQVLASEEKKASLDPTAQSLLEAAATDFHAHTPHPIRFRHVHIGHVTTPDGAKQYILCGEFLPARQEGKTEWMPFATIKTSGYEQYLGAQAASFCQRSTIMWDKEGDLSSSLQGRFDSAR